MPMEIVIGSSRHDENGKYTGGKKGDQKQIGTDDYKGEVSMQSLTSFIGSRKWYVLRCKNPEHAKKLASAMRTACNNPHIGYGQDTRLGVVTYGVDTKIDVNSDCGTTVRACIKKATGVDVGEFNTASEKDKLINSGLFEFVGIYTKDMIIYEGDVFITQKKGHTGICGYGNPRTTKPMYAAAKPTLRKGSKGIEVKALQENLNRVADAKLDIDGDFGNLTKSALKKWQSSVDLVADGIYGEKSYGMMWKALS